MFNFVTPNDGYKYKQMFKKTMDTSIYNELRACALLMSKEMLDVNDVALLYGLKGSYVRKLVEEKRVPFYRPFGKKLYFKKSELDALICESRVPSADELINQSSTL